MPTFRRLRSRPIQAEGKGVEVRYGFNEAGTVGFGCAQARASDDVHAFSNVYGLIQHSRAIAELLPRATYVELPDSGHLVPLEHPDVVGSTLLELVEKSAGFVAARDGT